MAFWFRIWICCKKTWKTGPIKNILSAAPKPAGSENAAQIRALRKEHGYKVERKALSTIEFECLLKQADGSKDEK